MQDRKDVDAMPESMLHDWFKVGFAYERYGYIPVQAANEEEAAGIAEEKLRHMGADEMEALTERMEGSEEIDKDGVLKVLREEGGAI